MKKEVLLAIKKENSNMTLKDILAEIERLQKEHPDMDIFFDGDEFAICGRKKPKETF